MVVLRVRSSRVLLAAAVFAALVGFDIGAAASSNADPQVTPDRWTQFVTDDGWVVDVNTTNEVIDHIDNLALAMCALALATAAGAAWILFPGGTTRYTFVCVAVVILARTGYLWSKNPKTAHR